MDSLPSELCYQHAGAPAMATVLFRLPGPASGDTITVNGVTYTYGTDFSMGTGTSQMYSTEIVARKFCERINGQSDDSRYSLSRIPHPNVFARVFASTVILYSRVPGTIGNSLSLATTNAGAFGVSGANFGGGSDPGDFPGSNESQGQLFAMPANNANGTEIGSGGGSLGVRPVSTSGIRLFVPTAGSVTFFFDAEGTNEVAPPANTVILGPGIYDFPLNFADSIYTTTTVGNVLGVWVTK